MNHKLITSTIITILTTLILWAVVILVTHKVAMTTLHIAGLSWNWKGTMCLILLKMINDNFKFILMQWTMNDNSAKR